MQKILPLIAVAITIAAVIILFLIEVINLNEFATQLAVGLTLLIPLPLAYALKPEIHKWTACPWRSPRAAAPCSKSPWETRAWR